MDFATGSEMMQHFYLIILFYYFVLFYFIYFSRSQKGHQWLAGLCPVAELGKASRGEGGNRQVALNDGEERNAESRVGANTSGRRPNR